MKKRMMGVAIGVLALMLVVSTCFGAEVYKPTKNGTGYIGTSSRVWGNGYFGTLTGTTINGTTVTGALVTSTPDFSYTIASKDWGNASGDWTLTTTEAKASLIYVMNANGAITVTAPSTVGRKYIVFNNSGQNCTIKKSGGTGITIANGKVAQVMYFQSSATTDYMRITADETF